MYLMCTFVIMSTFEWWDLMQVSYYVIDSCFVSFNYIYVYTHHYSRKSDIIPLLPAFMLMSVA